MGKIAGYELRRIMRNWLFLGMLAVNGIYGWYVLTMDIITGIAYSAPFSVWSYLAYLGKTMPLALITVLLMLAGYYGDRQKKVETLLFAAPILPAQHMMIRTAVLFMCFMANCIVTVSMAFIFYICFFRYWQFASFLLPSVLLILPCFAVGIGAGHLLGRLHPAAVYAWMLVLFLAVPGMATSAFDFFGAGFFSDYPLALPVGQDGEPGFVMSTGWILARVLYFAIGLGMLFLSAYLSGRKAAQDK